MKRRQLIRELTQAGCVLHRRGAKHDVYLNPATGERQTVPRHTEIDEALARHIKKFLSVEK